MPSRLALTVILAGLALAIPAAAPRVAPFVAQTGLAQLGLTEARARAFLFDEVKSSTEAADRRTPIAVTGHRAFYKLPAAARGPAATALFAWAKGYVNSAAFRTAYAQYRREANPVDTRQVKSVDQQLADQLAESLESIEAFKKTAASLPPADRDRMLASIKEQETLIRSPEWAERLRSALDLEQRGRDENNESAGRRFEERYPADPHRIVAGRLRRFLDETADADFSARIIRLTDGPDGMEFVDPAHRAKSTIWQLAVLAGAEATRAARASAEAWLKEIDP